MNINPTRIGTVVLGVFAFATVLQGPALASPTSGSEATSVEVDYSDIDLATLAGQEELKSRINGATGRVCGKRADVASRGVAEHLRVSRCMKQVTAVADVQVAAATRANTAPHVAAGPDQDVPADLAQR